MYHFACRKSANIPFQLRMIFCPTSQHSRHVNCNNVTALRIISCSVATVALSQHFMISKVDQSSVNNNQIRTARVFSYQTTKRPVIHSQRYHIQGCLGNETYVGIIIMIGLAIDTVDNLTVFGLLKLINLTYLVALTLLFDSKNSCCTKFSCSWYNTCHYRLLWKQKSGM